MVEKKTEERLKAVQEILGEHRPMTVRQLYYQLVSRQVIENKRTMYQATSKLLVEARQDWIIPWEWIEDRLRRPRRPSMWSGIPSFARMVEHAYRRNIFMPMADWNGNTEKGVDDTFPERAEQGMKTAPDFLQKKLIQVWLEKDALSGIFEDELAPYGVTLHVGRGFTSWTSLKKMTDEWFRWEHYNGPAFKNYCTDIILLCFSDFDPSGWFMIDDLQTRLNFFTASPQIIRCALLPEDIDEYNLPQDFAKSSDNRKPAFIKQHGDVSVELDALPVDILREKIQDALHDHMNMDAWENVKKLETEERKRIKEALGRIT